MTIIATIFDEMPTIDLIETGNINFEFKGCSDELSIGDMWTFLEICLSQNKTVVLSKKSENCINEVK